MDVSMPSGTTYILVIDTTAYAGNFERELCGFVTGHYDYERYHGDKEAAIFKSEEPGSTIADKITEVRHNEYDMVSNTIRATPGRLNNGMGWCYDADNIADVATARLKSRQSMEQYQAPIIAAAQARIDDNNFEDPSKPGAWTKEACLHTIESARAGIERAATFVGFPAFESVAIFFSEPLTDAELDLVKTRAARFAANPKAFNEFGSEPFEIRDIYMVRHTSGEEERVPAREDQ